jgi:biotin synthase-like enzyme
VAFLTKKESIMNEETLVQIVIETINEWAEEEFIANEGDVMDWNSEEYDVWVDNVTDRFNHNLETFIEVLKENIR